MNKASTFKLVLGAVLVAAATCHGAPDEVNNPPVNAIVKVEVETAKSDIQCPWANHTGYGTGSGVVIGDGQILTCAHCVADASYIRIRKHNEDTLYHANVLFIDHDADLALVGVGEAMFMADITPLEIGQTPQVQDDVLAVGYPIGGDDISYTRGIVSRIEDIDYSHGLSRLLGIQVDAAVNPGNSGGPVLSFNGGKIAGIVFQGAGKEKGEALGYVIPPDIICHFLKDIEDGKVDGFPNNIFDIDGMENPVKQRYYGMKPNQTGVIVDNVETMDEESIMPDDIILSIDGYTVSNNGRIRLGGGEARSLYYKIYTRQIGEKIPLKVLRDGKILETSLTAAKKNHRLCGWMYDSRPDYLLYGGLVFTTVSYDYILLTGAQFHDDIYKDKEFSEDEPVVISFYFSDKAVEGYAGCVGSLVRTVNGTEVRNLRHLAELLDQCREGFVRLGLDKNTEWDLKLIVDAKEMRESTARVMNRNLIPADRSEDLRQSN